MFRISLPLVFVVSLFGFKVQSQQRIGIDVSTQMTNLRLTAHYQKVIKHRLLFSAGFSFGHHGKSYVNHDTIRLYTGRPIASPFNNANQPIVDSTGTYSLLDYSTKSRSIGVQFGLGYFHEFDVQHGIRFNVNTGINFVGSILGGYYRSIDNFSEQYQAHVNNHFVGSVSLEAYHTIRLTGRLTFNYGVKVPYFFSIDKAKFNPLVPKDLVYGFEPQISIGMTRVIGKCD